MTIKKITSGSVPDEEIASSVIYSMTGHQVLSITRMKTGDQNFVYAVKTDSAEYVIRMTTASHKNKFLAAVKWQKMLLPLRVPVAEFIQSDLDGKYSPYPALLMPRLPGDDLINVYPNLSDIDKKNLANEMVRIQTLCSSLPESVGFGITDSYDHTPEDKTWFSFLLNRLNLYNEIIAKNSVFNQELITPVIQLADKMEGNFNVIRPTPFLWDASERNVLVHEGKITGIVDIDDICFGDPLLVIALTSTCLELEGYDTRYTDYWADPLLLDKSAQDRLNFYRLFYSVAFMRKHGIQTANNKKAMYDIQILMEIYHQSLERMNR